MCNIFHIRLDNKFKILVLIFFCVVNKMFTYDILYLSIICRFELGFQFKDMYVVYLTTVFLSIDSISENNSVPTLRNITLSIRFSMRFAKAGLKQSLSHISFFYGSWANKLAKDVTPPNEITNNEINMKNYSRCPLNGSDLI